MNTNPDHYKWGLFYFNPEDPRVIVPKVNKWMGWTFNFASLFSYLLILAIVLIAVFFRRF